MTEPRADSIRPPLPETNALISLIGRLPESHPVRLLALAVARGEPADTIQPLIDALHDPSPDRWRLRAVAAWALSRTALTREQADAATASLLDVLESARPEPRMQRFARVMTRHTAITFGGGLVSVPLVLAMLEMIGNHGIPPSMAEVFWVMTACVGTAGLPFTIPASYLFDRARDSRTRAAAAEALGRLGQPESVGALSGALFDRSQRVREAAAAALHAVLPLLTADHYGLFGAQSITNLGRALSHADAQLVTKVLSALAAVGTSHAIPYVKRVAQAGRTVRVRDNAAEVLAILERRQTAETKHATLLRPTISPADPGLVLVRPSSDTTLQTAPELMLRATKGEG